MTERRNLFAYTEHPTDNATFVGYVSMNREPDGRVTLTIRERGDGTKHATIELPPEAFAQLVEQAAARLMHWPLPKDFSPDCGITFDGRQPDAQGHAKQWPIGTNLLNMLQARDMLLYALGAPRG